MRTAEEINKEYQQIAVQTGDLYLKHKQMTRMLAALDRQLESLEARSVELGKEMNDINSPAADEAASAAGA